MDFSVLTLVEAVLSGVAVLLTVVGIGGNGWAVSRDPEGRHDFGLFQTCLVHADGLTTCTYFDQAQAVGEWLNAVRALVIIGFLLGVACVVVLVVYIFKKDKKRLHLVARIILFLTGDIIIIGIILYAVNVSYELGWSFALTTTGGALFEIVEIILHMEKKHMDKKSKNTEG